MIQVELRELEEADLLTLFELHRDPAAIKMAAFTAPDPNDRAAFDAKYRRIFDSETTFNQAILANGRLVGSVSSFLIDEKRFIGYWIDSAYWGRGITTTALSQFLTLDSTRPIHAYVAADNAGSIRVLEKCGFLPIGRDRGFAHGRGEEIEEILMELRG